MSTRLGKLLREKRTEARYTIRGLAGLLNRTPAQISAIERGIEGMLSDDEISSLARILGADPKAFIRAKEKDLEDSFKKQWPVEEALKRERKGKTSMRAQKLRDRG